MRKKSFSNLILVLIYQSNGNWTWYQIERELSMRGLGGKVNSVVVVNNLIKDGLVFEKNFPGGVSPYYSVSEFGKENVQFLVNEFGPDYFKRSKENPDDYE